MKTNQTEPNQKETNKYETNKYETNRHETNQYKISPTNPSAPPPPHWAKIVFLALTLTLLPHPLFLACSDDDSNSNLQNDAATDSGTNTNDASSTKDNDDDGYPETEDCDDNDPDIYPSVTRDCQSECDDGTETCTTTGDWSPCTAISDCDCTTPGETRLVDCEKCGQASQECGTDLKWSFPGECLNQKECDPGTLDNEDCEFDGKKTRICSAECEWGEWDESQCTECEPGTEETTSEGCTELWEIQIRQCDEDGYWETTTPCTADCILPARTDTEDYKEEICIPGGPFIMGSDPGEGQANEEPEHTVILTPYYIDKYEVSCGRYQECVDDGVCEDEYHYCDLDEPFKAVLDITFENAEIFCQWDGGRVLPTEAQWEKAARGPSPREVPYPWGYDEPTCDLVVSRTCINEIGGLAVDAKPDGVSFYGVFQMAGNVSEWCSDYYSTDYYESSPIVDPTGPTTGEFRVLRGRCKSDVLSEFLSGPVVTYRKTEPINEGFRCARIGY